MREMKLAIAAAGAGAAALGAYAAVIAYLRDRRWKSLVRTRDFHRRSRRYAITAAYAPRAAAPAPAAAIASFISRMSVCGLGGDREFAHGSRHEV